MRNKERRQIREKAKGLDDSAMSPGNPDSPSGTGSTSKVTGLTTRKCANCGQVGHIKTNKKLDFYNCSHCGMKVQLTPFSPIRLNKHQRAHNKRILANVERLLHKQALSHA